MEVISDLFTETRLTLIFLTAVVSVIYVITAFYFGRVYIGRSKEEAFKQKQEFFSAFADGLKNGTIKTLDDLVNIYKGVRDLGSEDLTYRPHLSRWLREFLVLLVSIRTKGVSFYLRKYENEDLSDLPDDDRQKYKDLITKFIDENDSASPYADLPSVERSIITDISTYAASQNIDGIMRKLSELASTIQAREEGTSRIQAINRWSVPLAVVGLVLTLLFGVLSLL